MSNRLRNVVCAMATVWALAGCDGGGEHDAAVPDGSVERDAGSSDAGSSDAGPSDAGSFDAGTSDAGTSDAGRSRHVVRVELRGDGAGRVHGGDVDCFLGEGARCEVEVLDGDELALEAMADTGSALAGWDVAGCTGSTCTLTVTSDLVVGVTFDALMPVLTVTLAGDGDGTVRSDPAGVDCGADCTQAYAHGTEVTLTAEPAASSELVAWGGACAGSALECTVSMTDAREVTATFAVRMVTLRVEAAGDGAGRVRSDPAGLDCAPPCEAAFPAGTTVTLTATPEYRSTLEGWAPAGSGCGAPGACALVLDADRTITATFDHHPYVRLSDTDRDPELRLRDDGLAVDFGTSGGVRSEQSVAPGSGVFYFEAQLLIADRGPYGFGVATASAPLLSTSVGATDQSFGLSADASILYDGAWLGRVPGSHVRFGLVVDYRGSSPAVHVVALASDGSTSEVVHTRALPSITTPLYIFAAGQKREPDWHLAIEPGNDTTNTPFALDPDAALRAAGLADVADALTLGWGDTYAGPPDDPPALTMPADMVVSAGTPVTLSASATDAEDGDLSASIQWELLSTPHYAGRASATGPSLSFTPSAVGLHPARARVRDHAGQVTEAIVRVRVPGPVAQHDPVRLEPDALSGPGVELSADGLSARWTDFGKYGVRANQSLYGAFWYFEIHRLVGPVNMGGGLVTGDGDIAPYSWVDVPGSCSINTSGGVWRDLSWQRNFPLDAASYDTYGFAVDYRGDHPTVYVITGGAVIAELVLNDVWVEVYPMLYGNPTDLTVTGEYDEAINFGATPFTYDAAAALSAYGVDATELAVGWGDANITP